MLLKFNITRTTAKILLLSLSKPQEPRNNKQMVEQPKLHLHLHVLLLLLFVFNHKCLCDINTASASTGCPRYTCNSNDNFIIRYPFYESIPTSSPQNYCGYPQFGLTCSSTNNNNQTLFSLANQLYVVKDIDYTDYTLSLVDADVLDDVLQPHSLATCPRAKHNTTIYDSLPLTFSSSTLNLTFYFNCTLDGDEVASTLSPISCLSSSADPRTSYVFLSGKEPSDIFDDWWNKCQDRVDVTVLEDQIKDNDLVGGFGAAIKQGFMLNWGTHKECRSCENNGGNCGYNTSDEFICYCKNGRISSTHCKRSSTIPVKLMLAITVPVGVIIVGSMILMVFRKKSYRDHDLDEFMRKSYRDRDLDEFMRNFGSLAPKQYNYSDVKRITNSFASKLGQGGYGCVYKGKLSDGRPVAVKILSESKGNGQDFFNEVASISRTSHVNVVSLLGFCCKGTKRALIYEFMSNFSLDKFLFNGRASSNTNIELDRAELLKIAIGIARGLEYLHSGCNTRILHLDIKPHNILLDQDWCPKISDFGLAKLCQRKESVISTMGARGTIGYIAPEVFNRGFGRVSYKSDVYSYGMMILEMAGVGKQAEPEELTETSEMYFPDWIYKRLEAGSESVPLGDNAVTSDAKDKEIERKMIIVGLWCIQTKPADRPSMTKVTEMLEGSSDLLQTPPKPFLFAPTTRSSAHYYSSSFSSTPQVIDHQS